MKNTNDIIYNIYIDKNIFFLRNYDKSTFNFHIENLGIIPKLPSIEYTKKLVDDVFKLIKVPNSSETIYSSIRSLSWKDDNSIFQYFPVIEFNALFDYNTRLIIENILNFLSDNLKNIWNL